MMSQLRVKRRTSRSDDPDVSGPWSILPVADTFVAVGSSTATQLGMPIVLSDIEELLGGAEEVTNTVISRNSQFWQMYVSSTETGINCTLLPESAKEEVQRLRDDITRRTRLTRQQIARGVGVDRRSLSSWAKGVTTPSADRLERLRMLADVVRDIGATGKGRAAEVLLSRKGDRDLLDHIAAGHLGRVNDWRLLEGPPSRTIINRRPTKRPLHQNALEAYLRGELHPLGRATTIHPESDYEQDLSKADRIMPDEPVRKSRRGYQ